MATVRNIRYRTQINTPHDDRIDYYIVRFSAIYTSNNVDLIYGCIKNNSVKFLYLTKKNILMLVKRGYFRKKKELVHNYKNSQKEGVTNLKNNFSVYLSDRSGFSKQIQPQFKWIYPFIKF